MTDSNSPEPGVPQAPVAPPAQQAAPAAAAPPAGYAGYPAAPVGPVPPKGISIASMICGIATFVGFGLLSAVAAVVLGHMGQKRQPYARGFWLTGLITGYVGIALSVIAVILFFLYFAFIMAIIGFAGYESSYDYSSY